MHTDFLKQSRDYYQIMGHFAKLNEEEEKWMNMAIKEPRFPNTQKCAFCRRCQLCPLQAMLIQIA
jgi:predicted aldo/keto reductase-like oxidoreductase